MVVINLEQSEQFDQMLLQAGSKPVFVDFFATWCGPCKAVAPVFEQLSHTYSQAVFLKVDVDELEDIAQTYGITAMPTFICIRSRQKLDELRGANPKAIEDFVRKFTEISVEATEDEPGLPKGQMNLSAMIDASKSECLNESDDHVLSHVLEKSGPLESDVDEQLLMTIAFNQSIKLHSLILLADGPKAPKTVKLFVNLPNSPDFDSAESMMAVQELSLTPDDMKEESIINLKYVKFQNIQAITVFIKDNQGGEETTQIDKLSFIGCPASSINMNDFKRVAGKKGESH